jgi:hypothetical protein
LAKHIPSRPHPHRLELGPKSARPVGRSHHPPICRSKTSHSSNAALGGSRRQRHQRTAAKNSPVPAGTVGPTSAASAPLLSVHLLWRRIPRRRLTDGTVARYGHSGHAHGGQGDGGGGGGGARCQAEPPPHMGGVPKPVRHQDPGGRARCPWRRSAAPCVSRRSPPAPPLRSHARLIASSDPPPVPPPPCPDYGLWRATAGAVSAGSGRRSLPRAGPACLFTLLIDLFIHSLRACLSIEF